MAENNERDKVIREVVRVLYAAGAHMWSVHDKGVLLAAVKLQLREQARDGRSDK